MSKANDVSFSSEYHTIGFPPNVSKEEVEQHAQRYGKKYRPDRGGKFITNRAREVKVRLQAKINMRKNT